MDLMDEGREIPQPNTQVLTAVDHKLIMEQCVHQNATKPEQIEGFTKAYATAKEFANSFKWEEAKQEDILRLVFRLSKFTEPFEGAHYAGVPRIFANGGKGSDPETIPSDMEKWAAAYIEAEVSPLALYKRFEEIHPFTDGNGRVGDLFWKIATHRNSGEWPETLPPNVFGENAVQEKVTESAFGEIED